MNKLENYIKSHTEPEEELLYELNRETHLKTMAPRMISGQIQGKLLTMLSHMVRPKYILEIGTFTGYSAICLAKGLKKDGELHTIEVDDEMEHFIRKYLTKANLEGQIKLHIGDALKIVPELNYMFDLVFIDGDKPQYLDYYHVVFDKVRKGGFIIADNVLWNGKVVEPVANNDHSTAGILKFNDFVHNDNRVENVIFPVRDGLMVLRKK